MLRVKDLSIPGLIEQVSFTLQPGERLGIIGESGSGKSLCALSIMGLLPQALSAQGSIRFEGQELLGMPERRRRKLRGAKLAMIFQEPMTALDPLMKIGRQLRFACSSTTQALALLADVGLDGLEQRYPHELSGGQRQRVLIALALAQDPQVLICDEPTTALDVTVQDQILSLIEDLANKRGIALIVISHDLGVIRRMCERIVVMRHGQVLESGPTPEVLGQPEHPYTQKLLRRSQPLAPALPLTLGEEIIRVEKVATSYALKGIDLRVRRGQRLGIVGGSGSGKTTLLKLIAGIEQPSRGKVEVDASLHMVFQDPQSSLNPRLKVGRSVAEAGPDVAEALEAVDLATDSAQRFPHEFSGGQRQRISIARALAAQPEIILADEPVSALDVSVRATVLELLDRLVRERDLTLVFVSHDLSVVRGVCDSVIVMHEGEIVESGSCEEIWHNPQHEYTKSLLEAIPQLE